MIRVLHINSNISRRSGIMSYLMNYYRHIDKESLQFDFLYYEDRENTYEEDIKELGGKTYKVCKPSNLCFFFSEMKVFYKNHRYSYDIVEIHDPFMFSFLFSIKKRLNVKSIIAHAHSTKFSDHFFGEVRNKVLSISSRYIADCFFACSQIAGEKTFGKKRFEKKGTIIHNAIDVKHFYLESNCSNEIRQSLGIDNKYVIGHIGNFNEAKNHSFLLQIFYELQKKKTDAVLVLVGDGELKQRIVDKCKNLNLLDKVLFLGVRTDIPKLLSAFDVFVFPSKYEGLGIALVEAQAVGLPCICSDCVPKEAYVANVKSLSLNETPFVWASAILSMRKLDNSNTSEKLKNKGFDIEEESIFLEKTYKNIIGE